MHHSPMIAIDDDVPTACRIPYLYITISPGGNTLAVGRPRNRIPRQRKTFSHLLATKSDKRLGRGAPCGYPGIPHLYRTIIAGRGDTALVGRPCHGKDGIAMTVIGEESRSSSSIPYLYTGIKAARGEQFSIR